MEKKMGKWSFILAAMAMLGACSVFENDAEHSVAHGWMIPAAYTSADVRIITQRERPGTNQKVVCAEPGADVAKAIATAFQATGKGGNGSIDIQLGLSGAQSEAIAELAGRSTALLGLRDGMYRACEAYANGAIGDDAYSLILSRYGQLMTTLFLAQDITGPASGGGAKAHAEAPTVNVNMPGSGGSNTNTGAGTGADKSDSGNTGPAAGGAKDNKSQQQTPPAPAADNGGAKQGKNAPQATADNQPKTGGGGISDGVAKTVAGINQSYFNLDQDEIHLLLVACINEGDLSRPVISKNGYSNNYLYSLCRQLAAPDVFKAMISKSLASPPAASAASSAPSGMRRTRAPAQSRATNVNCKDCLGQPGSRTGGGQGASSTAPTDHSGGGGHQPPGGQPSAAPTGPMTPGAQPGR